MGRESEWDRKYDGRRPEPPYLTALDHGNCEQCDALEREITAAGQIISLLLEDVREVGAQEPRERRIPTQLQAGDIREARTFCAQNAAQGGPPYA
ncbi:MAG: hypothetical protein HW395_55 [candidate division NC10 bacterium]|nr:hypothetical protein [candidate division NC10 bacterium]